MKKFVMLLTALSLAIVLTACGDDDSDDGDKDAADKKDQSEQASQDMPKPDLDDIPDVVASVNDEEIKKDEFTETYKGQFQRMAMQAQMTGKDLDQDKMKKQTAEGMVGNKLLIQEANSRDYKASDKEVDKTLKELSKQQKQDFDSTDDFINALEEQGMDKDKIMSQVKTRVKLDKLVEKESGDLEPTEKELKDAYDQYKKQQEQINKQKAEQKDDNGDDGKEEDKESDIASFDEKRPDLKKRVERQKEQKATQSIVDDLRDKADVSINL